MAATALYTCPAGETAIIKTVTVFNSAVAGNNVVFSIGPAFNPGRFLAVAVAANPGSGTVNAFFVLQPGDVLNAQASAAGAIAAGFGAELEGVAD